MTVADKLAARIVDRASNYSSQVWVAVTGVPGAGKSTICAEIALSIRKLGPTCTVVSLDGFHYYRAELDTFADPESAHMLRGAHWTFNVHKLLDKLKECKLSGEGLFPDFNHSTKDPIEDAVPICRERIVIFEGIWSLLDIGAWEKVQAFWDETWYLDISDDTAKNRLAARHVSSGICKDLPSAIERVEVCDWKNAMLVKKCSDRATLTFTHTSLLCANEATPEKSKSSSPSESDDKETDL